MQSFNVILKFWWFLPIYIVYFIHVLPQMSVTQFHAVCDFSHVCPPWTVSRDIFNLYGERNIKKRYLYETWKWCQVLLELSENISQNCREYSWISCLVFLLLLHRGISPLAPGILGLYILQSQFMVLIETSWGWPVPSSVQVGFARPAIVSYANLRPTS